jgi:hypothetical protein
VPTLRAVLSLLAVAVAAYTLFVFAGVAGCEASGSGTGDILRGETVPP